MKKLVCGLFLVLFLTVASAALAAPPSPLWSFGKADGLLTPESVYFDEGTGFFYVSNVAGAPHEKDGNGWISRLSRDGKKLQAKWVKGLDAPKGMRSDRGLLWVADVDQLVVINLKSGKVEKRVALPGAKLLNDVVIDSDGAVYASDTMGGKIFKIVGEKTEVWTEGADLEAPNGLFIDGELLYVAGWGRDIQPTWATSAPGRFYSIDLKTKARKYITSKPLGNLDGIEKDPKGGFFVSDWVAGKVFRVTVKGKTQEFLTDLKGAADVGIDSTNGVLVVPAMAADSIHAYQL